MTGPAGGLTDKVRSLLLTISAILGTLCLVGTVVAPLLDIRPLIFTSGSMSPAIPAGSLALAHTVSADELEVGDVVTVPVHGNYVTHRIVEITHGPGRATLILRGDGNDVDDAAAYQVSSAPRTFVSVPHLGTFVAWFSRAPGVYVLAAWVALVLGSVRGGSRRPQPAARPARVARRVPAWRPALVLPAAVRGLLASRRTQRRRGLVPVQAFIAVVLAAPWLAPTATLASDPDASGVTQESIAEVAADSAAQDPAALHVTPTTPLAWCRAADHRAVTVGWTPVAHATSYRLVYRGRELKTSTVAATTTSRSFRTTARGTFAVKAISATRVWISDSSNRVDLGSDGEGGCS